MTREEALKILDTIPTKGDEVDALEMAISALEQSVDVQTDTISRQAAIDAIVNRETTTTRGTEYLDGYAKCQHDILDIINQLPSAQPEIIRCKDCKHREGRCCDYSAVYVRDNGYCQWGERRER